MGSSLPLLETLVADFRYAVRMLRKSPGFTLVANPEQLVFVSTNAVQVANVRISRNISGDALNRMQERSTLVA